MFKMEMKGVDEYIATLKRISDNSEAILNKALYEGAGVMAEELKTQIEALPTVKDEYNLVVYSNEKRGVKEGAKYKLSETQKKGLLDSLGIAPFNVKNGVVDTHIGFDGYNDIKTKKYPKGQPNQLIAQVIESGSSFFTKKPFIRKAARVGKAKTEETMIEVIDKEINRLNKE